MDKIPNVTLKYKVKLLRNSEGNIVDFIVEEWNDSSIEFIKELSLFNGPVSYKALEKNFGFDKSFFEMFISNVETSPIGVFYFSGKKYPEIIFKLRYSNFGDLLDISLNIEREITLQEFDEINEIKFFYENIFHHSSDAIFIVEYKNNQFRYITNNKKHRLETRITFEAIHNKTPVDLVGPELGKKIEENYLKALNSNEVITYEEYLELPAGAKYWLTSLKKNCHCKIRKNYNYWQLKRYY
ncbi:MAG: hypothetical protein ACK4EX_00320 [Thermaurantimonas sp.]|uniref:hypothetical protein n=1 Tax=Thermaurantimonas sp. TaxID=2681568 RepID=UPI00391D9D32